jgi:hypothetical protein
MNQTTLNFLRSETSKSSPFGGRQTLTVLAPALAGKAEGNPFTEGNEGNEEPKRQISPPTDSPNPTRAPLVVTDHGGRPRQGMLALSIRQPWAWLICSGLKDIENRDWPTKYRGRFQIHASGTMTEDDYLACRIFVAGFSDLVLPSPDTFARGVLLGEADLVDCVTDHPSDWFCGRFGFVLKNARFTAPFKCPGRLGFFDSTQAAMFARQGKRTERAGATEVQRQYFKPK